MQPRRRISLRRQDRDPSTPDGFAARGFFCSGLTTGDVAPLVDFAFFGGERVKVVVGVPWLTGA